MNKQDKKILIFSIIISILFCIAFFGFFIWFGLVGYRYTDFYKAREYDSSIVTTQFLSPQDSYDISVTSFESSNIGIPFSVFNSNDWSNRSSSYVSSSIGLFSWRYQNSNIALSFNIKPYLTNQVSDYYSLNVLRSSILYDDWFQLSLSDVLYGSSYVFLSCNLSSNFNFNINKVVISSKAGFRGDTNYIDNLFTYYDNNDNTFIIAVGSKPQYYSDNELSTRTYFFLTDFTNNDYYQSGYRDGETAGILSGSQSGYSDGYTYGEQVGSALGYQNGINDANTYTFGNLLTAVIDAPVNVFMSLLDFNIMGYNLLTIVTGLLTFAFIVLVVKLLLGGR